MENKLSTHEINHDPDLNYFNNLRLNNTFYLNLEDINCNIENLNVNEPFNIMHMNCCSIYNKMNEIELLKSITNTKIIAVSESWLNSEIAKLINMQNFKFERKARLTDAKRGGVGFL